MLEGLADSRGDAIVGSVFKFDRTEANPKMDSNSEIMSILERKPRRWHYEFAHMAIPQPLFGQPDFFLSALDDPNQSRALVSATMARVAGNCGLSPDEGRVIADSIKIHPHLYVNGQCNVRLFVFEMPTPMVRSECYFAAIANTLDSGVHYFTLEKVSKDPSSAMLCSWDADRRHANYGDGTSVNIASFVDAVGSRLC